MEELSSCPTDGPARTPPPGSFKYARAAAAVRARIDNGTLAPGTSAPSAAQLARETGYSVPTCNQALRTLITDGVLVPGTSAHGHPRVPRPAAAPGRPDLADAARALSAALAGRRRAAGLTQPELADIIGVSVTAVGHAETARLWHAREFWERADNKLSAGGELLALHDSYRQAGIPQTAAPSPGNDAESAAADTAPGGPPAGGTQPPTAAADSQDPAALLTCDERQAVRQAGILYTLIAEHVVTDGPARDDDLAELRAAIHLIQRTVLAQAAARAYPKEFRLLGTTITRVTPEGSLLTPPPTARSCSL